jgi:hypothetical protein
MSLRHKVKEGLDETRLLILGAQVLFGFKLTSVFQEGFAELSHVTRIVDCAGQFLMALAIGLLIAPSMQHHISEKGRDTLRLQRATGLFAGSNTRLEEPIAASLTVAGGAQSFHALSATGACYRDVPVVGDCPLS